MGRPLVLKLMLDIVMYVYGSTLYSLPQSLHMLWLKDVPGENAETVASYLKGVLLLFQNYSELSTEKMYHLTDTICSANCEEFSVYIKIIYFMNKQLDKINNFTSYLNKAKQKHRILYRNIKWRASKSGPASGFYINNWGQGDEDERYSIDERGGCGRGIDFRDISR